MCDEQGDAAACPGQPQAGIDRYWELACLDPEITKGNITGQLKALDALCEELKPASGEPRVPRVSGVYRAAWLDDANLEQ